MTRARKYCGRASVGVPARASLPVLPHSLVMKDRNAPNRHGKEAPAPAGVPARYPPGSQPRLRPGQAVPRQARLQAPVLLVDLDIVRAKTRRFRAALPRVRPHFAVKANPDPRVLKVLMQEGAGFEIASIAELDLLLGLGVPVAEVFYSNPMKSRAYLEYAAAKGVEWYVVDSVEEIRKVQSVKADAKLYLRIDAPNIGSDWPLAGKFGAHMNDVPELIQAAVDCKADLAGVTFHVGSQCLNPENWRVGMERARKVFADAHRGPAAAPAQPGRRLSGAPREADALDRDDRRGDQQGAAPLRARRSR